MSGHSKWSTIKRKKGAADSKRSQMFSRISKELTVAVKEGGADPDSNPRLRMAIQNAKGVNMPKDNVNRAINKGESDDANFQEVTFEGYANSGIALFVECLTDNNNRTVASIRSIFNKKGGSLGTNGSLSFLFDRKGIFTVAKAGLDIEEFELNAIDAGAEDFEEQEEHVIITTALEDFGNMQKKLDEMGIEVENAELQRIPNTTTALDVETAKKVLRMIDVFEEDDDVQNVFHNLEITEELAEALGEE
ncbi:MAG: YebC/PmpR family DNA-binding transcriptional regulator [Bacteroidales bacterium]|nr:YebC/PmpR family DNA-binding transcriptional regulator [Bacteroidales bacterium]MCF8455824.1 YebC/PmpR family DNA-binding transcriptional regulator [Bacteroidales bacterium]